MGVFGLVLVGFGSYISNLILMVGVNVGSIVMFSGFVGMVFVYYNLILMVSGLGMNGGVFVVGGGIGVVGLFVGNGSMNENVNVFLGGVIVMIVFGVNYYMVMGVNDYGNVNVGVVGWMGSGGLGVIVGLNYYNLLIVWSIGLVGLLFVLGGS